MECNGNETESSRDAYKIQDLERQLREKDATIEQLMFQINQMQITFHDWVERSDDNRKTKSIRDENQQLTQVSDIPINADESYFSSYAHFHIHHEMLSVSDTNKS